MKHSYLLGIPFLALALAPALSAQTFIPHPPRPPRYIVLDTRRLTTVKQELTLIAMQGYRATYVAPRPGSPLWPAGMTMILEKLPEDAQAPEYVLVEEKNGPAIQYLLDGGRKGFRYVRNSAFEHKSHDFWGDFWATAVFGEKHVRHEKYDTFTNYILLELSKDNAACRYRTQRTKPGRENLSPKHHFAEGFQIAGEIEGTLVLENCMVPAVLPEKEAPEFTEAAAKEKYRLLSSQDTKKKQKELAEAVGQGFQVSHANGNLVCLVKNDSPDSSSSYTSLAAKTEPELEKKLNSAAGFRMVPETLARKSSFWSGTEYQIVMEKVPADGPQYRYRILREKNGNEVQDLLNVLSEKGYEVKGMNRDAMGITVLMEKMVETEIPLMEPKEAGDPD